jgi:hypothetical protein
MLFEDFGCERFVISSKCPIETVLSYVCELADPVVNAVYREKIALKMGLLRSINAAMWERVSETLNGSFGGVSRIR